MHIGETHLATVEQISQELAKAAIRSGPLVIRTYLYATFLEALD
jgi:hypothetical protein